MSVGIEIKKLRKARGWTLEELSNRTKLGVNTLNRIELGRQTPSSATVAAIMAAFGIQEEILLARITGHSPQTLAHHYGHLSEEAFGEARRRLDFTPPLLPESEALEKTKG